MQAARDAACFFEGRKLMILDCAKYSGPCSCGREHPLETKMVAVEYGALNNFDEYMDRCGLTGRRTVLYDTNTYNLPGMVHVRADKEMKRMVKVDEGVLKRQQQLEEGMNGNGRILVRPSGTEPKIKVYLSGKGKTDAESRDVISRLRAQTKPLLGIQ